MDKNNARGTISIELRIFELFSRQVAKKPVFL